MTYDSTNDVLKHIGLVRDRIHEVIAFLNFRKRHHDGSKLQEPEKSMFDEYVPKLKEAKYGSNEYKQLLISMGEALQHHYQENSHHPEHYKNGIDGMSLIDLVEMFCDWKAANDLHTENPIPFRRSIRMNMERFNMSEQVYKILMNTADELDW